MADPTAGRDLGARPFGLRHLDPAEFRDRLNELLDIYVEAMRYPAGTGSARAMLWVEHCARPGFDCVIAVDDADTVHGLAYGYRGLPGQWWHGEVQRGLGSPDSPWLHDYVELTELHVRPASQGGGLGEALLRALVVGRSEHAVLLSTPEGTNRAWRLYRRLGFVDVLRDFRFTGDPRPFGVLGRRLPLDPARAD
jgi:ribosomal protein S18 acetylase RimI-like enzyme